MTKIFNSAQQQFLRDAIGGKIALVNIANMAEVTNMYSTGMMHDILAAIPDSDMRRHVARMIAPSFNKMVRQLCHTHTALRTGCRRLLADHTVAAPWPQQHGGLSI